MAAYASHSTYSGQATTHTATAPTGVVAGDLLVAYVDLENELRSVSTATGWTLLHSLAGTAARRYVYYRIATGTDAYVFVLDTSGVAGITVVCFNGSINTATPIVEHDITQGLSSGSSKTTGTITPTVDGSLIVMGVMADEGAAAVSPQFTEPAGFTERYDWETVTNDMMIAGADMLQATAAAISGAWTQTNTAFYPIMSTFAIRPASATTGRRPRLKVISGVAVQTAARW